MYAPLFPPQGHLGPHLASHTGRALSLVPVAGWDDTGKKSV